MIKEKEIIFGKKCQPIKVTQFNNEIYTMKHIITILSRLFRIRYMYYISLTIHDGINVLQTERSLPRQN